jgi:hypothetical protein
MKKIIALAAALAVASPAFADGSLTSTNTVGTQSGAASTNTVQPVQSLSLTSNGSRQPANAPELAVGGSIGTHLCETQGGISGGWMTGDAGVIIPVSRQYCVYMNVMDEMQQSAVNEQKDGRPEVASELRDASYELLSHVDATVKAVLSRHNLLKDGAKAQADASGTEGAQPQAYAVADPSANVAVSASK